MKKYLILVLLVVLVVSAANIWAEGEEGEKGEGFNLLMLKGNYFSVKNNDDYCRYDARQILL